MSESADMLRSARDQAVLNTSLLTKIGERSDRADTNARDAMHATEMIAQRLDSHLTSCERRYAQNDQRHNELVGDIKDGFKDQSDATRRIHGRFDALLKTVIASMGAIILMGAGVIGTVVWYVITSNP